jgi:hypothetical protein
MLIMCVQELFLDGRYACFQHVCSRWDDVRETIKAIWRRAVVEELDIMIPTAFKTTKQADSNQTKST